MDINKLSKKIFDVSHLTGNFTLRSGQKSSEYFDKYQFTSDPRLLGEIAIEIFNRIILIGKTTISNKDDTYLAGLEMGGIPIAVSLGDKFNFKTVFVRKAAKTYGTCKFAEGPDIVGKTLIIIEDVVTTGGQIIKSVRNLRERGAIVNDCICVINRKENNNKSLETENIKLHSLFSKSDFNKFQGEFEIK